MNTLRRSRVLSRAACAALALAAGGCWDDESGADRQAPIRIYMNDHPTQVIGESAWLGGEVECPNCTDSGWVYGSSCPVFQCPPTEGNMWWTNSTTGATSPAIHGMAAACHCQSGPWMGYCYSACSHVWSALVPLAYGGNDIVVSATVPGYAQGSESILIERVPATPAWTALEPGPGQVTLSWMAVPDASSYNLYWSTTAHGGSSLCTKIGNVMSPYTHTGLASGVEHYYFVTALVRDAESFDSLRTSATPQ